MKAVFIMGLLATLPGWSGAMESSVWIVPWDAPQGEGAPGWACFNEVNPFVYAFNKDQELALIYPKLLEEARARKPEKTLFIPVIVNDIFDSHQKADSLKSIGLLSKILSHRGRMEKHAEQIARLVEEQGFDGIEIDYERVPPHLWGRFGDFNEKLASLLHAKGKRLNIGLEGGLLHRMGGVIPARYWKRLASSADLIKLMCYYERSTNDEAGPGSSKDWVVDTVRRALTVIAPEKLSVSLSLAGMQWPEHGKAKRIHYFQVQKLLERPDAKTRWDDARGAPVVEYTEDGKRFEVWFEDERSLGEKAQAVQAAGARHISLWYLGSRQPKIAELGLCPTSGPAR